MAMVWECPCGVRSHTCYLTPDGKRPMQENCPICKKKLKLVGTTPRKVPAECIVSMKSVALFDL